MADDESKKDDKKEGTAHPEDLGEESQKTEPNDEAQSVQTEPDLSAEEKLAQIEKDHLYLRAELENIKRQNLKERSQLLKYGAERLARDLLDTLDVFNSALKADITNENYKEFVNGVEMTAQSLKANLEKHGIVEIDCVGKAFDPNTQEALSSEPSSEYPEGFVTQVFKAPYNYHDKLLRPGQVIVSRPKSE